jgi:peptidoglycan/LPS O-acetylase OafA/YrhL
MVLLYHAGLPFVPGGFAGVDVFFVISGFLITGLMVRELERTGRLSLRNFWARRAKRLLPATAVVLVVVTGISLLLLPKLQWASTAGDIVAASLYTINWRLAASSVDYLAQDYAPSPVQHFWSLAVEEQFYVIWPLLVLALAGLNRRLGWSLRRTLLIGVTVLTVGSLVLSIRLGGQPQGYFVTTTRAWQLGLGSMVALLAPRLRTMNRRVAGMLTWTGAAGLVAVALWLPDSLPWPSWNALAPTVATAAVIAGGPAAGAAGAGSLLGMIPLRRIGDLSYSLYLWHWPFVVFATVYWEDLTPLRGLVAVTLSFGPAYLTHRLIESPLHHSRTLSRLPRRALALGATCMVVGMAAGLTLRIAIPDVPVLPAQSHLGASALLTDPEHAVAEFTAASITPDPLNARADLPDLYGRRCQGTYTDTRPRPCIFDPPASAPATAAPSAARVTVALVGDSRAAQWSPAIQAVAAQQNWRVITITKAGCPFTRARLIRVIRERSAPYSSCTAWDDAAMKLLLSGPNRPDFVVTSAFYPYLAEVAGQRGAQPGPANDRTLVAGFRAAWTTLNQAGIPVVALRETPLMGRDVAACVSAHRTRLDRCSTARTEALSAPSILQPAAAGLDASATIDLTTSEICPGTSCPPVIGNVLVYRDNHHLTAEYSSSLAPFLTKALTGLRAEGFAAGRLDAVLPP